MAWRLRKRNQGSTGTEKITVHVATHSNVLNEDTSITCNVILCTSRGRSCVRATVDNKVAIAGMPDSKSAS